MVVFRNEAMKLNEVMTESFRQLNSRLYGRGRTHIPRRSLLYSTVRDPVPVQRTAHLINSNPWIPHPSNLLRTHHPSPTTCPSKLKKESACVTHPQPSWSWSTQSILTVTLSLSLSLSSPFRLYHSSHHSACSGTKTSALQPSPYLAFFVFLLLSSSAFCLVSY